MRFVSLCFAALTVALSSCSPNLPVQREDRQAENVVLEMQYSIVFIIHGDGDYLYHDTSGIEYGADEEALAGAKMVALQNPLAEVFIFYQRPRRNFLFFFPLHDGEFYFYRNGRLVTNKLYSREIEQSRFGAEIGLYGRFHANNQRAMTTLFLYSGHEIPEFERTGYDVSLPDRTFSVSDLATGLKGFTGDSARFDLMVLSTCFGGTPYTVGTLGSCARYIIASPDNLHLSYFDLSSLERLDQSLGREDMSAFAANFAHQAIDRLKKDIQTAVSVVVYDVDRVQEFLRSVRGPYDLTLTALKTNPQVSMTMFEHCDCSDLPAYALPTMSDGVDVFYRPARFGRSKDKQDHSGWGCWKERSQDSVSEVSEPVSR